MNTPNQENAQIIFSILPWMITFFIFSTHFTINSAKFVHKKLFIFGTNK